MSPFLHLLFITALLSHLTSYSNGFTIELIHPHSPKSPFYNHKGSHSRITKMFSVQSSKTVSFNDSLHNMKFIRPSMERATGGYLVKLNIGGNPNDYEANMQPLYKTYYLRFDIASDVTWVQCEDCIKPDGHCFHQAGPPYPKHTLKPFGPLPCGNHKLCFRHQCLKQYCSYNVKYADGTSSFGILKHDVFHFGLSHNGRPEYATIVIGCGLESKLNNDNDHLKEMGVLGMGWNPHSFVNQITPRSHGKFSYCLPPLINNSPSDQDQASTILRFGSDVPSVRGLRNLHIEQYSNDAHYYVELEGISINNMRLNIPSRYFTKAGPNYGGCYFDTRQTFSSIPQQAFKILKDEMIKYLARTDSSLNIRPKTRNNSLCFWRHPPFKGFTYLPTITFHFERGVDLVQQRDIAFIVWEKTDKEYVCMTIEPTTLENNAAIIGTQSQANHVFVYDLPSRMMYFGPQDCALNH